MKYFKNYCRDCGIVIIGVDKDRCTPCHRSFLRRCAEDKIKSKQMMEQLDNEANKELDKFYNKLGIRI